MNIIFCCTRFGLKIHGPSRKGVVPIKKLVIKPCLRTQSDVGSKQAPTGSTCQNMIRAFPMDWIPQDWMNLHPSHNDLTCRVDQIYIYIFHPEQTALTFLISKQTFGGQTRRGRSAKGHGRTQAQGDAGGMGNIWQECSTSKLVWNKAPEGAF